jgi:hypothetical protein
MRRRLVTLSVLVLLTTLAAVSQPARAQTFTASTLNASTGNIDSASAVFSIINGSTTYLQIVLTNTSTFSSYSNPDLLSGLFFAIASGPALTPASATTTALINPSACASPSACSGSTVNVGNQWGYVYSTTGFTSSVLTTTAQYGIAAPGYSGLSPSFGKSTIFGTNPPKLAGNGTPQLAFSVVGADYNASSSSISSKDPLINSSITLDLALPAGVSSLDISNVTFAYGTAPDGSAPAVRAPEPASIGILASGLAVVGFVRRRKGARCAG